MDLEVEVRRRSFGVAGRANEPEDVPALTWLLPGVLRKGREVRVVELVARAVANQRRSPPMCSSRL